MGRTFRIEGDWLGLFLYGSQIAALVFVVLFVAFPLDGVASIALAVLFRALVSAVAIGLWRRRTDREGEHSGTAEDITHDPIADPGQAAKHRWKKAVCRLPDGNDEQD